MGFAALARRSRKQQAGVHGDRWGTKRKTSYDKPVDKTNPTDQSNKHTKRKRSVRGRATRPKMQMQMQVQGRVQ